MTTREDIKAIVYYLKGAFPNYNPVLEGPVGAIDILYDLLGDIETDLLRLAVKASCSELGRQFAPSAGEIRQAAVNIRAKAAGLPDAAQAWGIIVKSFKVPPGEAWQAWKSENPLIDHPAVREAIDTMGGLRNLEMSENPMADRAHFLKMFDIIREREINQIAELPAITEYVQNQLTVEESKRLGDGNHAE